MLVRYIARDPHGGVHVAPDNEEPVSHCIAVRKRYSIVLANARKPHPTLRHQYDLLNSMSADALQSLDAGRWRARIGDLHYTRMRERAAILLLGTTNYEEYEEKTIMENVRRVEDLRAEGFFDRWHVVSWMTSFEQAEQEGAAMALQEEFRDVAILDVNAGWYVDTN